MLAEGDRLALEFAAQAAEVADDVDCGLCLRACLGAKRVPGLERNRARQLLDPCLERVGDPREKAPALAGNRARPGGEGIGRGLHCARDVLSAPSGNLSDRAPVRRILDLERLASSAIHPLPTYQHARFPKRHLVSAHFPKNRHDRLRRSFGSWSGQRRYDRTLHTMSCSRACSITFNPKSSLGPTSVTGA